MSFGGQGAGSPVEQKIQFEMVFGIISGCFDDCVTDFKSQDLTSSEQTCLSNCAARHAGTQELIMQIQNEMSQQMGGNGSGF